MLAVSQTYADDQQTVTAISGTPGPDTITVTILDSLEPAAEINTELSQKVEASATGIDSLAGNDTITVNAIFNAAAAANAILLQTPVKKTEAVATSTGINAGDDDDAVDNNLAVDVFGSSLGAYGTVLQVEQPPPTGTPPDQNKKQEMDASVSSQTVTTGVAAGTGADSVQNDGALIVNGLATSGTVAGDLAATVRESSTVKTTSASEVSSTGIQAGGGDDIIANNGVFTTTATATSGALSVGLVAPGDSTPPSDNKVNIKTESNATSKATVTGIHGDEDGTASNLDDSSPFGLNGLRVTYEKSVITVSGDDIIMNNTLQTGIATATSGAGSGSISNKVNGSVQTEAKADAEAAVTGINAGGGSDGIVNQGELLSTAIAHSGALAVAVEVGAADSNQQNPQPSANEPNPPTPSKDKESKSSSDTSATAKATATGITADGDAHSVTSNWTLELLDNALQIDYLQVVDYLYGNDTITNFFSINTISRSTSLTDSLGVTVSSGGSAESKAKAEAESYGASIVAGAGDDSITNRGLLTTESTANATAVSLGLAVGQPPQDTGGGTGDTPPAPTIPDKITSKSETNVTAKAHGYGIDADGLAENVTTQSSLTIGVEGLDFSLSRERQLASGNDNVNNEFAVSVVSSATADSLNAGIKLDAVGSVNSEAKAAAESLAAGITTGTGADTVSNNGLLKVSADARADSVSLGLTASKPPEGETTDQNGTTKKDKSNVKSEAGATATAEAIGIDAEGKEHLQNTGGGLKIAGSGLAFQLSRTTESLAGHDSVTNTGVATTSAVAESGTVSAGISIEADGSVDSEAGSRATARSGGILTGGGADTVDNQAVLSSDSTATATLLSVSVGVAQPTDSNGEKPSTLDTLKERFSSANSQANAEATASASGIDTEGEAGRQLDNLSVTISSDGLLVDADSTFTSAADKDRVINSGALTASSTARTLAGGAEVKVQTEGTASSETNATAKADAGGVLTGGGADVVVNAGVLTAHADAEAGSASVSFTQPDGLAAKSKTDSKAVAEAAASGIATDGGRESASLTSHLDIGVNGIDFTWHSEETASTAADSVINTGAVIVTSQTLSGASGGAVSMDGPAKADVTANSASQSAALDTGGGNDFIDNEGWLTATSGAVSGALAFGFGQNSDENVKTKVAIEGGATSKSRAIGISGDGHADIRTDIGVVISSNGLETSYLSEQTATIGSDVIQNQGGIDAIATSAAGGLGAVVAVDGVAKADVNVSSNSRSAAIEGGAGDDRITSTGDISATSTSDANSLAAGVGKKTNEDSRAKTKVDSSSIADASVTGIAGDGGFDDTSRSVGVAITDSGLQFEYVDQSTAASGDDEITNSGVVTSGATANSGALSVAVSIDGAARADANDSATACAAGLDSGAGGDLIDNSGTLDVSASATSKTLNAAISSDGRVITNAGLMDGGNKAGASAVGITSAGGQYQKTTTVTGSIDYNSIGVEAGYEAVTDSISGDGVDNISNSGSINASSDANAPEATSGITSEGLAVSTGRTQVEAKASAIDAGNLGDTIGNSGDLTANATSTAVLANVAVTGKGLAVATNAVWDGGTESKSSATGIDADSGGINMNTVSVKANEDLAYVRYNEKFQAASGDDTVVNSGRIDATASALSPSLDAAVEPGMEDKTGIAVAVSTSSAEGKTTAIHGGDGDDDISNSGMLNATANATAVSVNAAVVNLGVAAAADAIWDGGTNAEGSAVGIAGDGGDRSRSTYLAIGTDEFKTEKNSIAANGSDNINNRGEINVVSTANAASVGVPVAVKGVGVATSTATSSSLAEAIDAGSGESIDYVSNLGPLTASSTARAATASVSVTNEGLAVSADSVWNGGTKATAFASGIDVGAGNDVIDNGVMPVDGTEIIPNETASMETTAHVLAPSAGVTVALYGVAAAESTATAQASALSIEAGEGNDTVTNHSQLTTSSTANADAVSVSVTEEGLSASVDALLKGGVNARAATYGIDGDGVVSTTDKPEFNPGDAGKLFTFGTVTKYGSGDDTLVNRAVLDTTSTSIAGAAGVSVAVEGVAVSVMTANAESRSIGINGGDGNDGIKNFATLTTHANANADTVNVAVAPAGAALAADAVLQGGTRIKAEAGGITADDLRTETDLITLTSDNTGNSAVYERATDFAAGDDSITNEARIEAHSVSFGPSIGVSYTDAGLSVAAANVTSTAQASAINGGDGADDITNSGELVTTATSNADAVNVAVAPGGVSLAADALFDGGSKAKARAVGIDSDGMRREALTVTASDGGANGSSITVDQEVVHGSGTDSVTNTGRIEATARAFGPSIGVSVVEAGVGAAITTMTADAVATGIAGGGDSDIISNGIVPEDGSAIDPNGQPDMDITASSIAATINVGVVPTGGVALAGDAVWDGGTTATSNAVGILSDGIGNSTTHTTLSHDANGFHHDQSSGEVVDSGNDLVTNTGELNLTSNAYAPTIDVAVAVAGVAGVLSTATGEALSTGIDTGAGEDTIYNYGAITTDTTANAEAVNVAVTPAGVAVTGDAAWDGGTHTHAASKAIASGDGLDYVRNNATLDINAHAIGGSLSVPVAVYGVSAAVTDATSVAEATCIDAGGVGDTIDNFGQIKAHARADVASIGVSVNVFGVGAATDAVWSGGTHSQSTVTGIAGYGGGDVIQNGSQGGDDYTAIDIMSTALTAAGDVPFTVGGVAAATTTATARAEATALSGGDGSDTIFSGRDVLTKADATSVAVTGSIGVFGVALASDAVWNGGTHSSAYAYGFDGGADNDTLINSALADTRSVSRANSDQIAVTVIGVAGSIATSNSTADSSGMTGGDGDDMIANHDVLNTVADARATSVAVDISGIGAAAASDAFWNGGTGAEATAYGISGGAGNDNIYNTDAGVINVGLTDSEDAPVRADTDSVGVAASLGPVTAADSSSTATTHATVLAGGDGDDFISNRGDLNIHTLADAGGVGVTVLVTGASIADSYVDALTKADANGVGIAGDAGRDTIYNWENSDTNVDVHASSKDTSVALTITGGFSTADASTLSTARASGIAGGDAHDDIYNYGATSATATANTTAQTFTWSGIGDTAPDAHAGSATHAYGIDAGCGNSDAVDNDIGSNDIVNTGSLNATSTATAVGHNIGIVVTGAGLGDAGSSADAEAVGIAGADGVDTILNSGLVTVSGTSDVTAKSIGFSGFGYSVSRADATATTLAKGAAGGAADDTLINTDAGTYSVTAEAMAHANGVSTNIIGKAKAEATTTPTSTAIGFDGGAGDDGLGNSGGLTVNAHAKSDVGNTTWTIGGVNVKEIGATTAANATGIDGGEGDDTGINSGIVTIGAASELQVTGSSWTLTGKSADEGSGMLLVTGTAAGAVGGAGRDTISNRGEMSVAGTAKLAVNGGSKAIFGGANTGVNVTAGSFATGLDGGEGDDILENLTDFDVTARSILNSDQAAFSFIGSTGTGGTLAANAHALGLDGGGGIDRILNEGTLTVGAIANMNATGRVESKFGNATAVSTVTARAETTGVDAGAGNNMITNRGTLKVGANATPHATSNSSAGGLFGDGVTRATVTSGTSTLGINIGADDNTLVIEPGGTLTLTNNGATIASATSNGTNLTNFIGTNIDTRATANTTLDLTRSRGVIGGDGDNDIQNDGNLTVTVNPEAATDASADGDALINGAGTGIAESHVNGALAQGIALGDGANTIINNGALSIELIPLASATAYSDADGIDFFKAPSSTATATATADNGGATGIIVGNGDNSISNHGALSVRVAPQAKSDHAFADFGQDILAIDSFATATANVNNTTATGIMTGNGSNSVWNTGDITITAAPYAGAVAIAKGVGFDGDAFAHAEAHANNALAVGIRTGDGNNTIVNDGTITVLTAPLAATSASATPGTGQYDVTGTTTITRYEWINFIFKEIVETVTNVVDTIVDDGETEPPPAPVPTWSNARAVGIMTGGGDDSVTNNGMIAASISTPDGSHNGIGISTGAGDDTVTLGDGSAVTGDIDLGENNDTLHLIGAPTVDGDILTGGGADGLIFDGEGTFVNPLDGFVRAAKQGAGTYIVPSLQTMRWLDCKEGTLQIDSDYLFDLTGSFQTGVKRDGSHGKLSVLGTADLAGEITVLRGPGAYLDGTTYDIIEAAGALDSIPPLTGITPLTGEFSVVNLPTPTTLLNFQLNQLPNIMEVEVNAESFTTVASNGVEQAIAHYLDRIIPTAVGDLSNVIGEFQLLSPSAFGTAFSGLSPVQHVITSRGVNDVSRQYTKSMLKRTHSLQATGVATSTVPQISAIFGSEVALLAYNGSTESIRDLVREKQQIKKKGSYGVWLDAFGQWGDHDPTDGFSGYNFDTYGVSLGFDRIFKDSYIIGIDVGYATTDQDLDSGQGTSEIKSLFASLYGSYFTKKVYIDAVLSYGRQDIETRRQIRIGSIERMAGSDHDGDVYSAFVEGGYNIKLAQWTLQPFGNLQYLYLDEGGFQEGGADSLNQIIGDRQTDSLQSDLGFRLERFIGLSDWTLIPEISLAWLHDYDIDNRDIVVAFAGAPEVSFTVDDQSVDRDKVVVGAGLMLMNTGGISTSLIYNGEFSQNFEAHGVMGELRVEF